VLRPDTSITISYHKDLSSFRPAALNLQLPAELRLLYTTPLPTPKYVAYTLPVAISPGIPTSFVPKTPQAPKRGLASGHNLFLVVALFLGGLAVIASVGTYLYDQYLTHELERKAEALAVAQREVNEEQVEDFVRLRDRLTSGRELLQSHIALSQVFDVLEAETLTTVRFSSLKLTVADDHTAQLDIEGTARNFNALAAQSNAFAGEKGIRRAIFSGIVVNRDNTVSFRLTADLDSRLVVARHDGSTAPAPDPLTVPAVAPTPAQTQPATTTATTTRTVPTPATPLP